MRPFLLVAGITIGLFAWLYRREGGQMSSAVRFLLLSLRVLLAGIVLKASSTTRSKLLRAASYSA